MKQSVQALICFATIAASYELPENLIILYNKHKAGSCSNRLSEPFDGGASYCGDIENAIFLKSNGGYDNMDIDCDGSNNSAGDCANDPTGQGQTAFKDTVRNYGIDHGLKPLSVMAVVCDDKVFYGVWGDTNGFTSTSEASIALAQLCFPNEGLNGNNGHDPNDVLYLGFIGDNTAPGAQGAIWDASSREEFQESIRALGEGLVAGLSA
uniref:Endo-chitosanase n=1 Tax=Bionectria ochroleuca TaxID=29856 RepID=A0A8H7NHX1_BIOOC